MAYKCPRCDGDVQRANSPIGAWLGLVGALVMAAFASFECPKCGPIARSEFPAGVRSQMLVGSLGLVLGAVVVLVAVIALITWVFSW